MRAGPWIDLIKRAAAKWSADGAPQMGAALAYYGLFSLAPLIVIAIAVAGAVFGPEAARGEIRAQLTGYLGAEGAVAIETMVEIANKPREGFWAAALGIGSLIFGAVGVLTHLNAALGKIWANGKPAASGLLAIVRTYVVGLGMVLGLGAMVLVSVTASLVLGAIDGVFEGRAFYLVWLWRLVELAVSTGILFAAFALTFRVTSDLSWRAVATGAIVTAILFVAGKALFGLYIELAGVRSAFGAAGSLVIGMVWMYYSAQIFFFGAEIAAIAGGRWQRTPKE